MRRYRTSESHPIEIGTVSVPGTGGAIGITFCPGKKDPHAATGAWDRDLDTDLAAIRAWGCSTLVCLVEQHELEHLRVADLPQATEKHGMRFLHLPIRDCSIPEARFEAEWRSQGRVLREALRRGERILVHCKGGLGRSGTIAARLLVEFGMAPDDAIAAVRAARSQHAIETEEQERYVRRWFKVADLAPLDAEDRAAGALLGLAVGDAVGTTLEFTNRDTYTPLTDMIGGGPFNLPAGTWTDDTSMALCLAESLLAKNGIDQHDLMQRFTRWWRTGENSATGRCFDIGGTTSRALALFEQTGDPVAGSTDPRHAGNGSLMRLAPVSIFHHRSATTAAEAARKQSVTTHGAPAAVDACAFFAELLVEAINGTPRDVLLQPRHFAGDDAIVEIASGTWRGRPREDIRSSGYVVHTLEAALWCVAEASSFRDAVLLAANLGGDADTVAAVTGQLAGAVWGASAIPSAWLSKLVWRERIEGLATALYRRPGENQDAG